MHAFYFQLGNLQIPVFGVFAALGIMAALALSQITDRHTGLKPESVWNVGITGVISAFVISRLLLVVFNLHSFIQQPLLILALPSLTSTGILLTAIFMFGYIRWQKLRLLPILDAMAPCAALLWAFLSLGRELDGTRDGMPTRLPAGTHSAANGSVHPVELYTFVVAILLCIAMFRTLQVRSSAGETAGITLSFAGLAIFFIDFLRLPSDLLPDFLLDPSQIIGIAMILVGAALFLRARPSITRESGNEPPHAI